MAGRSLVAEIGKRALIELAKALPSNGPDIRLIVGGGTALIPEGWTRGVPPSGAWRKRSLPKSL